MELLTSRRSLADFYPAISGSSAAPLIFPCIRATLVHPRHVFHRCLNFPQSSAGGAWEGQRHHRRRRRSTAPRELAAGPARMPMKYPFHNQEKASPYLRITRTGPDSSGKHEITNDQYAVKERLMQAPLWITE